MKKKNGFFLLGSVALFCAAAVLFGFFGTQARPRFALASSARDAEPAPREFFSPKADGIPEAAEIALATGIPIPAEPLVPEDLPVPENLPVYEDLFAPEEPSVSGEAPLPDHSGDGFSWAPLIARLAEDGYDMAEMEAMFTTLAPTPLPEFMAQKVIEIAGLRFRSKASLALPKEEAVNFSPPNYASLGGLSATAGRAFMDRNKTMFTRIYERQGVAAPYIVAILMVETGLGGNLGSRPAMLALGSMASSADLDAVLPSIQNLGECGPDRREILERVVRERSEWAYNEARALIDYCKRSGKDPLTLPGSVYGAIGLPQFMPSNIASYGVDADGDKVVDLFKLGDAAWSIARYLNAHGWKNAETESARIAVLKRYNNSDIYASTVYGVAMQLIAPSTHVGAEAARQGTSAVTSARESARAVMATGTAPDSANVNKLNDYSELLK